MAVEQIGNLYDLDNIRQQTEAFIEYMAQGKAKLMELVDQRITVKNSDLSSFTQATQKLNTVINESNVVTQKAVVAKKELTQAEIASRMAVQQRTAATKLEITANNAAVGSINQLKAQLALLTNQYNALTAAERQAGAGKGLQTQIAGTQTQLNLLNADLAKHQGNVGNYANSIGQSFKQLGTQLLQYIGIIGAVTMVGNFFKGSVDAALEEDKALHRLQGTLDNMGRGDAFDRIVAKTKALQERFKVFSHDDFTSVFEKLITYGKLTENQMDNLIPVITNFASKMNRDLPEATSTILKAIGGNARALKDFGINLKDAKTESERFNLVMAELERRVKGATDAFGKSTAGKIKETEVAFHELKEEIGNNFLPIWNKVLSVTNSILSAALSAPKALLATVKYLDFVEKRKTMGGLAKMEGEQVTGSKNVFTLPGDVNPNGNKILGVGAGLDDTNKEALNKAAAAAAKAEKIIEDSGKRTEELNKKAQDEIAKANESEVKSLQDKYKHEYEDQEKSQAERTNSLLNYYYASQRIIELEKQAKLADNAATEKENIKKAIDSGVKGKPLSDELIAIKKSRSASDKLALMDEQKQLTDLGLVYSGQQEKQSKEDADKQVKIEKAKADAVKNVRNEEQVAIEASNAETMSSLDQLLKDKKITQENYDKEKTQSIRTMEELILESQLKELQGERNILIAKGEDLKLIDAQIRKQKALISSAKTNLVPDDKKKISADQLIQIGQAGQDLATGLVDIKYQKELEAIQKIIDLNNIRKDQEIANINASTLSNQEKAAQLIILDKTVAANNQKLAREEAAIKIKQAKFDRDAAILSILEQAAIAMFRLTGEGGFVGLAAGIALGVEAAAQIAMILAKPLPSMPAYKGGRGEGKEELALVHPGEYIHRATGIEATPAIESLTHLMPKDKVYKNKQELMRELAISAMPLSGYVVSKGGGISDMHLDDRAIIEAIENGSKMTVQAMKKQKGANVNIRVDGYWGAYITKSVRE